MRFAICFIKSVLVFFLVVDAIAKAQDELAFDSGADVNFSYFSNPGSQQILANGFELEDNYQIESVTWHGLYFTGDPSDPLVDDNFTIQIHGSDDSVLGGIESVYSDAYESNNVGFANRVATGETLRVLGDEYDVFQYSVSLSPFALRSNTSYWLSISNESTSPWSWAVEQGSGDTRARTSTTSPWEGFGAITTDYSLFGSVVDLPDDTTSRWTAGDGFFDNQNNWDTAFAPANVEVGDQWDAIIDVDSSSPFEIRMREDVRLQNFTMDSENGTFIAANRLSLDGSFTLKNGLFRMGSQDSSTGGLTTVSQLFENYGDVEITRNGALQLIFDARFVQHSGSFLLGGAGIENQTSNPLLFLDGSLEGSGRIGSSVDFGGTLSIGQSAGRIEVLGDWTFLSTSESLFEIGGLDRGVDSDWLNVVDSLVLDGVLAVELIDGFDLQVQSGDIIEILRGSALSGEFLNVSNGGQLVSVDGRSRFTVHYGSDSIYNVNAVVLSNFVAVPEPSALFMLGAVGAAFCTRRRRNRFANAA